MEETRVTWRLRRHLHVATASSVAQQKVTVVAFGDSITQATSGGLRPEQGWPMLLRAQLQQHFPWLAVAVVNAGVGGNTSREGLSRIRRDVLDCRPDFVTFEFGNVSAACSFAHAYTAFHLGRSPVRLTTVSPRIPRVHPQDVTSDPARHVPLSEYARNLSSISAHVTALGASPIPMTFSTTVDGTEHEQEPYRVEVRQFAKAQSLPLVDLDAALRREIAVRGGMEDDSAVAQIMMPDGVHLTPAGNECVAAAVAAVLIPQIEGWLAQDR